MLGGHLLGLYEKAMPDRIALWEKFSLAKELGFDYVEISVDETDERIARLYMTDKEQDTLLDRITSAGLRPQSLCLSAHRRFPFGSADETVRQRAYDIMERAIRFAHRLGIRVIQLAGYDVYYEPSTPESLAAFLQGLRDACAMAARYQVMLAMEIMDTKLMSSIGRYMEYKKQLPSPWFTVYPDVGNLSAWQENDVFYELSLGKHEMVAIHIKETQKESEKEPGCFKRVPFGTGCVNFQGIFAYLEGLGYSGPYTMEMWHREGGDAKMQIKEAKAFIERQFYGAVRNP